MSNYVKGVCERRENKQCALWVADVQEGFQLIFDIGYVYKSKAVIVDAANAYMNNARRSLTGDEGPESLEDVLAQHGYSYDFVQKMALPSDAIQTRDDEPALISRYMLKNVKHAEGNKTHDYMIHHFEDGTAHLLIPFGDSNSAASSKTKRHNGAGVKIAFKHETLALAAGAPAKKASAALASSWQEYAEAGHGEMMGFVEQSDKALFYYRTIVEGKDFGEEYESVDYCGNLGQYVGTFLGPGKI